MASTSQKSTRTVSSIAGKTLSNPEIVAGLASRDARATAALYDRFGPKINRLVWRLLGADDEHDDVVHQVFIHILTSIGKLRSPDALEDWITGICVNTVRREIRRRKYRRIVVSVPEYPEHADTAPNRHEDVMVRRVFAVLKQMKTDDHIAFGLRFIEGAKLEEVAQAGGYSLATAKRRITRAKKEFMKRAAADPFLATAIEDMTHE